MKAYCVKYEVKRLRVKQHLEKKYLFKYLSKYLYQTITAAVLFCLTSNMKHAWMRENSTIYLKFRHDMT